MLKAARTVDFSISGITAQQKWMWTHIHNISLTRYMGKEKDGGLRKLREELEAENSGVQIPAEIRWLGGAKVRARFQERREGASSVVAAVLGGGNFQPPLPIWSSTPRSRKRRRRLRRDATKRFLYTL